MAKLTTFTVKGRGRFPLDMLRYDCAWPSSGEDVAAMESSLDTRFELRRNPWAVRLVSESLGVPTVDRWASFGSHVTIIDGQSQ